MSALSADGSLARPATSTRKLSWDVIRAATMLMVMLYHSTYLGPVWHPELATLPLSFDHPVGASTLLIVSGYFAAVSLQRRDALRWWMGRMFRMLPAFWVAVLATGYAMRTWSPPGWWTPTWEDIGANMAMLWQWKPQMFVYVDASYWTLPVQLSAFTMLLVVARYSRIRPPAAVLLWTVLALEAVLWPIRVHTTWEPFRMFHDGLGWHRMHLVVVGIAVFLVARGKIGRTHGAALVIAGMVLHGIQTDDTATAVGVALLTAAVWAAAVGPDWDRLIPAFLHPAIRWMAGISYGVYLMHQSIGYIVMGRLNGAGASPWIQVSAMLATGVLLGWLLTAAVERPAYDALTRLRDRYMPPRKDTRPPGSRPKAPKSPQPSRPPKLPRLPRLLGPAKPPRPARPPRGPDMPRPRGRDQDDRTRQGPPGGVAS